MNFMTNIDLESNDPNTTIFGNCAGIDFGSCASGSTSNNNQIVSYVPVGQDSRAGESPSPPAARAVQSLPVSRYENQKRRDWNTFCQYLRSHIPPVHLNLCNGGHVLEFLRYLDQFGKTKVHNCVCAYFGVPNPPAPCPCPLRQAWGSLDALIGRLRAAYEEHGGQPESNPFGARDVRLYLREVREYQTKARGISYEKKRKRPPPKQNPKDA